MTPEEEGWHYISVTNLFVLLGGVISKHNDDFYYMNCLNSFRTHEIVRQKRLLFCWNAF